MSSSSVANGSRSPSPSTPDSPDSLDPVAVHNGVDACSWYSPEKSLSTLSTNPSIWDVNTATFFHRLGKAEEQNNVLCLNDLIDENAYDDSQPSALDSGIYPASPDFTCRTIHSPFPILPLAPLTSLSSSIIVQPQGVFAPRTNPLPPPFSRSRKRDPMITQQNVIFPPKESCQNLTILAPNIPEGGTKSRVETQVRVMLDLADTSSSCGDPHKYDRVGSWNWLKLPPRTATKKRTRKQGKIDPAEEDILHLTAAVTCASPPQSQVLSCSSCQAREAKRVARKLAARVRPLRSDSDSGDDAAFHHAAGNPRHEDTTSIIQFNCAEVLDFATGSVILPLRITCYCRHHREKVGFHVHMTMKDYTGRIVATGTTRPIMITDDHKSTGATKQGGSPNASAPSGLDWEEWPQSGACMDPSDRGAPSKRKIAVPRGVNSRAKTRAKPYDLGRSTFTKHSREGSVTSFLSPSSPSSPGPGTRSPTPPPYPATSDPQQASMISLALLSDPSALAQRDSALPSAQSFEAHDVLMPGPTPLDLSVKGERSLASHSMQSPISIQQPLQQTVVPMPFMFYNAIPNAVPTIHRLIPSTGPTFGGIEVTVLGTNFLPSLQLNCAFGGTVASATHRWSDNTLVCVLPPRQAPGVVEVWFDGFEKDPSAPVQSFTYSDESDRALMELALQVVGLKMTGKIEDAKNVAMRIVGNAGDSDSGNGMDTMMQMSSSTMSLSSTSTRDLRPLLLRAGDNQDFESLIVDFLSILDVDPPTNAEKTTPMSVAISHQTPSGHTLLHLGAALGFVSLVKFVIDHEADLDVRDRNGCTALHFAALGGSKRCVRLLLEAGADLEIVNALGKRPDEDGHRDLFVSDEDEDYVSEKDDEEADWGDGENEAEDEVIHIPRRKTFRRLSRRSDVPTPLVEKLPEESIPPTTASEKPLAENIEKPTAESIKNNKQAASFVDMLQRTLAQLYAAHGIMPNMPQLPLPHIPGMPVVPWGALPQIPVVFPVYVPMPFLGSLLGEKRGVESQPETVETSPYLGFGALKTAQDTWDKAWEKWMAMAAAAKQQTEAPPPMYTPRADSLASGEAELTTSTPPTRIPPPPVTERPAARRLDYDNARVPDQEFKAFGYRPEGQLHKMQKKHDRMLILFWIPILFLSLLYAFYNGLQEVFHLVRTALPVKTGVNA